MTDLIVLSELNCISYMRAHGFTPSVFYTDFELFKNNMMYFDNVTVVLILAGASIFSKKAVAELITLISHRAEDKEDRGIVDLIVVSNEVLPHCKDYFLYDNNPLKCIRYNGSKPVSKEFNLSNLCEDTTVKTKIYLTMRDYGINKDALFSVKAMQHKDEELRNLIKLPVFK